MSAVTPKKPRRTTRKTTRELSTAESLVEESTVNLTSGSSFHNTTGSPMKRSRVQEKAELGGLNNRLAAYIETVRRLESEKSNLELQLTEVESTYGLEKDRMCSTLEAELTDCRDRMEQLTSDNVTFKVERDRAMAKASSLKNETDTLRNNLERSQQEADDYAVRVQNLEAEIKLLKEKLAFANRTHSSEVFELKKKRTAELTAISKDVENKYESQFQEQMDALRAQYASKFQANRGEIEEMYNQKLSEANANIKRARENATKAQEEAAHYRIKLSNIESSSLTNASEISLLKKQLQDAQDKISLMHSDLEQRLAQKDDYINEILNDNSKLMVEYQDLMDIKVQLDMELDAYRRLLEGEETRLNISQNASMLHTSQAKAAQSTSFTGSVFRNIFSSAPKKSHKRARVDYEDDEEVEETSRGTPAATSASQKITVIQNYNNIAESFGDLEIADVDVDGRFITVKYKGTGAVCLDTYKLKCSSTDKDMIYKFNNKHQFAHGESVTVYSSDAGVKASPPSVLVMKSQQWALGDAFKIELLDQSEKVIAYYQGQLGDSSRGVSESGRESCSIM